MKIIITAKVESYKAGREYKEGTTAQPDESRPLNHDETLWLKDYIERALGVGKYSRGEESVEFQEAVQDGILGEEYASKIESGELEAVFIEPKVQLFK